MVPSRVRKRRGGPNEALLVNSIPAGNLSVPAGLPVQAKLRIVRAASLYLMLRDLRDVPCRFDVLGLDPNPDGWTYTLLRNAFEA